MKKRGVGGYFHSLGEGKHKRNLAMGSDNIITDELWKSTDQLGILWIRKRACVAHVLYKNEYIIFMVYEDYV
jgi:hypothetical protein